MSANGDMSIFGIFEDLILTKNGVWLSNGEPIEHEKTLLAFSRNLYRCEEGFEIRLGSEHKVVHVEDTLYFILSIDGAPELGFTLKLNDGRLVELNPSTLQYKPGRLTCKVYHPTEKTHEEAKFLSAAYYELLKYLEKTPEGFGITIEGVKVLLGKE
jgi:hypothetical protein